MEGVEKALRPHLPTIADARNNTAPSPTSTTRTTTGNGRNAHPPKPAAMTAHPAVALPNTQTIVTASA